MIYEARAHQIAPNELPPPPPPPEYYNPLHFSAFVKHGLSATGVAINAQMVNEQTAGDGEYERLIRNSPPGWVGISCVLSHAGATKMELLALVWAGPWFS